MKKVLFETETEINYQTLKEAMVSANKKTVNLYLILAFLLLLSSVCLFLDESYSSKNLGAVFFFLMLWLLWIIFPFKKAPKISRESIQEKIHSETMHEKLTFYDDCIVSKNLETNWEATYYYNQFILFLESEHLYILKTRKNLIVFLSKDSFNKWESSEFKEFIQLKIKENTVKK